MSRPKLTSLSAIMPPKGGATRPEPVADPVIKQAIEQTSERERTPPSMQDSERATNQPSNQAAEIPTEQASVRASMPASEHASKQAPQQLIQEAVALAGDQTIGQPSMQASDRTSGQPIKQAFGQADNRAGEISSKQAIEHAPVQAIEQPRLQPFLHASEQASLHDPFEYLQGPRSAVSFRMTERLQERLREFAHRSRRTKQDIMDQAVHEFLLRAGF